MADDLNGQGNGAMSDLVNSLNAAQNSGSSDERVLTEVQGVTESAKDINEQLAEIVEILTGLSSNAAALLSGVATEGVEKATNGNMTVGGKGEKEEELQGDNEKTSKVEGLKPSDLQNLSFKYSASGLLVWGKLNDIQTMLGKELKSILTKMSKTGDSGSKKVVEKGEKEEKGMKLHDFNPDTIKKLGSALTNFAKACILMSLVPPPLVDKSLKVLKNFIEGLNETIEKIDVEKFDKMAKAMVIMDSALTKFALACIALSITLPFQYLALLSLPVMSLFMKTMDKLGKDAKDSMQNFDTFAMAMVKLGIAFTLFGIAALVLVQVTNYALEALIGLGIVLLVMAVVIVLGIIALPVIGSLASFSVAMIGMAVAFILFGVAMKVLTMLKLDTKVVKEKLNMILDVTNIIANSAGSFFMALIAVIPFTVFSVLFTVSLIFTVAAFGLLIAVGALANIVEKNSEKVGDMDKVPKGIALAIRISSVMWDNTLSFLMGTIGAAAFAVFSAVFAISMLVNIIAVGFLAIANLIYGLVDMEDTKGYGQMPKVLNGMSRFSVFMWDHSVDFLKGCVGALAAVVFAGLFAVFAFASKKAFEYLRDTKQLVDKLGGAKDMQKLATDMRVMMLDMLCGVLGVENKGNGPSVAGMIVATKNAIAMAALAAEAIVAVGPVALFFLELRSIATSINKLQESLAGINEDTVIKIFGLVAQIMHSMAEAGTAFKGMSAKAISAVGSVVESVTTSLGSLTDVVLKLKDGIPDEQIQAATHSILRICSGLFGDPNDVSEGAKKDSYTLTDLFATLAGSKLKKLKEDAIASLPPLIDTIDSLADLVLKVGDPNVFSDEVVNRGLENLGRFTKLMSEMTPMFSALVKKEGGFLGFGGKTPLDAVKEINDTDFFGILYNALESFNRTSKVAGDVIPEKWDNFLAVLNKDWATASSNADVFFQVMSRVDDGLGELKSKHVSELDKFLKVINQPLDNLDENLDKLSRFADRADDFESICKSFNGMADAFGKMEKKSKGISSILEALSKKSKESKQGAQAAESQATDATSDTVGDDVSIMAEILQNWAISGVPIAKDGTISPKGTKMPTAGNADGRTGL